MQAQKCLEGIAAAFLLTSARVRIASSSLVLVFPPRPQLQLRGISGFGRSPELRGMVISAAAPVSVHLLASGAGKRRSAVFRLSVIWYFFQAGSVYFFFFFFGRRRLERLSEKTEMARPRGNKEKGKKGVRASRISYVKRFWDVSFLAAFIALL